VLLNAKNAPEISDKFHFHTSSTPIVEKQKKRYLLRGRQEKQVLSHDALSCINVDDCKRVPKMAVEKKSGVFRIETKKKLSVLCFTNFLFLMHCKTG